MQVRRGWFLSLLQTTRLKLLLIAILLLGGITSTLSPAFLTLGNVFNILEQLSINAVMAAGMTFVIIAAGIDLSVGSILAVGSMAPVALLGGLLVGLVVGSINGLAIAYGRVPAFVMTLGMLNAARGGMLFLTEGNSIRGFTEGFLFIGQGRIGPVPTLVIITVLVYLVCHGVLVKMRFGRYTFAIGNDPEIARRLGVRVRLHTLVLYALSGMLAAFAGALLAARLNSALTLAGTGKGLEVIAAVVIGGTSLYGGKGSIPGTFLGVLFLQIVRNALNLLGISTFLQQVAVGALLIFSALVDVLSARWSVRE